MPHNPHSRHKIDTLAMHKRRFLNLPAIRQTELRLGPPWLKEVHQAEQTPRNPASIGIGIRSLALRGRGLRSARERFVNRAARRDALHAKFCALLVAATTALSFVFCGRQYDRLVFRELASVATPSNYCSPHGGQTLGRYHFHVALPELDCVFYGRLGRHKPFLLYQANCCENHFRVGRAKWPVCPMAWLTRCLISLP